MAKKNNTANKSVYKDFDDEEIPNDFIQDGWELKKDNFHQWIQDAAGEMRAMKCPSIKAWCQGIGKAGESFNCFGCPYLNGVSKDVLDAKKEAVNHPLHYGGDTPFECIKVLAHWLSKEEYRGFCRGNFIKYVCRLGKKDDSVQELKKARFYLDKLIESYEA